uniref:Uncharacterized protein n=1 Tax=Ciona savignyi TaxID=51511 RepID=H2Z5V0_CIOSA
MADGNDFTKSLFAAIEEGNLDEVKKLFENNKASPDIYDENGMTPLMQAAYKGNQEICEFLLEKKAAVNASEHENRYTALMMAALSGKSGVVQILLDNGANADFQNSIGKRASELAAFVGQHEIANKIKNYLSLDKLEPYTTGQGSNPPRLPLDAAIPLQKIVMMSNPHPVKIVTSILDCDVINDADVLKKIESVLSDLGTKSIRSRTDYDEVLALKTHYLATVIEMVVKFMKTYPEKKLDTLIKQ